MIKGVRPGQCMCERRPLSHFDIETITGWIGEGKTLEYIAQLTQRDFKHLRRVLRARIILEMAK